MYFKLKISHYPTMEASFAAIPAGVTSLDLSGNDLGRKTGAELATAFVAIPAGVTSLDLSENSLGLKTGAELALAFAAIPAGVTSLNLRLNDLGRKTGAELATAFTAIPAGVTSLNLSWNGLNAKTGAELALAFAAIPAGVTSLNLSSNHLNEKTGAELALAFAAIPAGVTSLKLSWNGLNAKTGAELALAFAAIPAGVTSLNLSWNGLGRKTGAELAQAFATLPAGITVSFKGDNLFKKKTRAEIDASLTKLRQANLKINLDLSGNGESDVQRAIAPLACLAKKPLRTPNRHMPQDVLIYILSFLLPEDASLPRTYKMFSDVFNVIQERPSLNNVWGVGCSFPLYVFNKMFNIPQASEGVLLIKDAEKAPNEQSVSEEDNADWFAFMLSMLAMKETQLAAIALGTVILLACSGAGMIVLGGGLVTAGSVGLAMNFFSPHEARDDTDFNEASSTHAAAA